MSLLPASVCVCMASQEKSQMGGDKLSRRKCDRMDEDASSVASNCCCDAKQTLFHFEDRRTEAAAECNNNVLAKIIVNLCCSRVIKVSQADLLIAEAIKWMGKDQQKAKLLKLFITLCSPRSWEGT